MRSNLLTLMVGISLIMSSACATKSGTGAAVGSVGGGIIGTAIGGTTGLLIGAAAGGVFGFVVGKTMEEEDRRQAALALERNRRAHWRNAKTGNEYDVVPMGASTRDGRKCREFRVHAEIDERPEAMTGIACRRDDGSWEVVDRA